jgi:two-component system LytT family response regulator
VIFVTAYEQFSLQAFDVHALDYLLKPFQRRRFQEALRRVRQRLNNERELAATRVRLAAFLDAPSGPLERLAIRTATKVTIVRVREVDWIQGDGNYVRVHVGSAVHLLRQTMKSLVAQLDPRAFLRIHNSYIVNVERVRELLPWSHGEYVVVLEGGTRLISGRSYGANLRRVFAL